MDKCGFHHQDAKYFWLGYVTKTSIFKRLTLQVALPSIIQNDNTDFRQNRIDFLMGLY